MDPVAKLRRDIQHLPIDEQIRIVDWHRDHSDELDLTIQLDALHKEIRRKEEAMIQKRLASVKKERPEDTAQSLLNKLELLLTLGKKSEASGIAQKILRDHYHELDADLMEKVKTVLPTLEESRLPSSPVSENYAALALKRFRILIADSNSLKEARSVAHSIIHRFYAQFSEKEVDEFVSLLAKLAEKESAEQEKRTELEKYKDEHRKICTERDELHTKITQLSSENERLKQDGELFSGAGDLPRYQQLIAGILAYLYIHHPEALPNRKLIELVVEEYEKASPPGFSIALVPSVAEAIADDLDNCTRAFERIVDEEKF